MRNFGKSMAVSLRKSCDKGLILTEAVLFQSGSFRRVSVTDNSTFTSADHGPVLGGSGSIPRHTAKKVSSEGIQFIVDTASTKCSLNSDQTIKNPMFCFRL